MSVQTIDFIEAIEQLEPGRFAVYDDVSWEEYEELSDQIIDDPSVCLTYDRGRLEIMPVSGEHDHYSRIILLAVAVLCDETDREMEPYGSMTLKQVATQQATEPDECFYIRHAHQARGIKRLDLRYDPPPDLAVEIDITHGSMSKLPIYAEVGVPEVWRYNRRRVQFFRLVGAEYVEIPVSDEFPFLTPQAVADVIALAQNEGQTTARRAFREWVRANKA